MSKARDWWMPKNIIIMSRIIKFLPYEYFQHKKLNDRYFLYCVFAKIHLSEIKQFE
jgi:hypothetical protein